MHFVPDRKSSGLEVRCPACRALLGVQDSAGLSIKRGDAQATVSGVFLVSLVCWRRNCRRLMTLQIDTRTAARLPVSE